jgi:hypothetical protein
VFTARYALSPYMKQIRFVFKELIFDKTRQKDVLSGSSQFLLFNIYFAP